MKSSAFYRLAGKALKGLTQLGVPLALTHPTATPGGVDHMHVHVGKIGFGLAHQAEQKTHRAGLLVLQPNPRGAELIEEEPMHHQTHRVAEPVLYDRAGTREVARARGARDEATSVHARAAQAGATARRAT